MSSKLETITHLTIFRLFFGCRRFADSGSTVCKTLYKWADSRLAYFPSFSLRALLGSFLPHSPASPPSSLTLMHSLPLPLLTEAESGKLVSDPATTLTVSPADSDGRECSVVEDLSLWASNSADAGTGTAPVVDTAEVPLPLSSLLEVCSSTVLLGCAWCASSAVWQTTKYKDEVNAEWQTDAAHHIHGA